MDRIDLNRILDSEDTNSVVESVLASGEFNPTREVESAFPYKKRVSIDQIVPIDMQNRLMLIDTTLSTCYWQIGDATSLGLS